MEEYVENIKYQVNNFELMGKRELLALIVEVIDQKLADFREEKGKSHFHELFFSFMKSKYKSKKLIEKRIEQAVGAFLKFSEQDERVNLVRRFLNLGSDAVRRVRYECFFVVLKRFELKRPSCGLQSAV